MPASQPVCSAFPLKSNDCAADAGDHLRGIEVMPLLRERDAALAVNHQAIHWDETDAYAVEREPVDLGRQIQRLRDPAKRRHIPATAVDIGPQPFAFDTDHENTGLHVRTAAHAAEPALDVESIGRNEVRPALSAPTVANLRADPGAGPVVAGRRACRRDRMRRVRTEAVVDAELGEMERLLKIDVAVNGVVTPAAVWLPVNRTSRVPRWT